MRRILTIIGLLLLLCGATPASAQVAFDAGTARQFCLSCTTVSVTHVVTGSNTVLFATQLVTTPGDLSTGCTYNSVSMTLVKKDISSSSLQLYLYGLIAPASGSHTLTCTAASSIAVMSLSSESFTGASQSALPTVTASNRCDSTTTCTGTLTTTVDNSWVVLGSGAITHDTVAGTNTTAGTTGGNPTMGYYGPKTSAGSIGLTVTTSGTDGGIFVIVAAIEPVGGATSVLPALINRQIRCCELPVSGGLHVYW